MGIKATKRPVVAVGGQHIFGFSGVRAEQISADGAAVRLKSGSFDEARSDRRQRKGETQKGRWQRDRRAMDRHATERRPRVRRGTTGERGWDRADDSSHRSPESRNFCNKASRPSRHCARQPPTYNRVIRCSWWTSHVTIIAVSLLAGGTRNTRPLASRRFPFPL